MPTQLSLFDIPSFNIASDLKAAMHKAVSESKLSREKIVDKMNALANRYGVNLVKGNGSRLTMDTFEKWLNVNDTTRNINIKALPIFCAVLNEKKPLEAIIKPLGLKIIGQEDLKLLEWAKLYHKNKQTRQAMKKLESEL